MGEEDAFLCNVHQAAPSKSHSHYRIKVRELIVSFISSPLLQVLCPKSSKVGLHLCVGRGQAMLTELAA